jgi:hypothetical protein
MACTPEELAKAAKCFECLDPKTQNSIQTYLLAVIAGVDPDPSTLAALAKHFQAASPLQLQQMQAYLLCQIADAS